MSTVGSLALTMADYRKRMDPNGQLAYIIETLAECNPIMDDAKFMQGNLPTGNVTTQRTSIPRPKIRVINQGVKAGKSTTKQITDTCCLLENRSKVDVKLLKLQPDPQAFRRSEDAAIIEGFSQEVAEMLFYGNTAINEDTFNGLSIRYNALKAGASKGSIEYQVVSAGTPNAADLNTSAFLVGWGEHATTGIYPKNTEAGLQMQDLGENDALDDNGDPYRALQTLFTWDVGLAVRNIRQNAALRNINVANLQGMTSANKLALIENFIVTKNRIQNLNGMGTNHVWYVPNSLYTFIECYLIDKNNVHVTRQELMGQAPVIYLSGIKVQKCDAMIETEKAITA